jgi:hypothetical protein
MSILCEPRVRSDEPVGTEKLRSLRANWVCALQHHGATVGNGSSSLPHAITLAATSAPMIKAIDLFRPSPCWRYKYRIFIFSLRDQFRINQPRAVSWSTSGVTDTRISPGRADRFTGGGERGLVGSQQTSMLRAAKPTHIILRGTQLESKDLSH